MLLNPRSRIPRFNYPPSYFEERYEDLSSQQFLDDLLIRMAYVGGSARVLDLGCGVGHLLKSLKARAASATAIGIDFSNYALEQAREHAQVILGDIEQRLPFKNETFDVVFAKDVVEHVARYTALLLETKRVLKSGGDLVIVTPNFMAVKNLLHLMFAYRHPHYFDPTHRWFFSYINTERLSSGYDVVCKTTNWILTPRTQRLFKRLRFLSPIGDSLILVMRK